mgnify:CR=1 FL=1
MLLAESLVRYYENLWKDQGRRKIGEDGNNQIQYEAELNIPQLDASR